MVKISVITPCFNARATLAQCLNSVAEQTHRDVEHVIVDGGSEDGSLAQLQAEAKRSPRLRLSSGPDRGIYDAMNKGIRGASGDVIAVLNADDRFFSRDTLADVAGRFEQGGVDIVISDISYEDREGNASRAWRAGPFFKGAFFQGWHPPHPGFFARRSLFATLGGFDLSLSVAADFELMMRFMEHPSTSVAYLDRQTVIMRDDGVSGTLRGRLRGALDLSRALYRHGLRGAIPWLLCKRYLSKSGAILLKRKPAGR